MRALAWIAIAAALALVVLAAMQRNGKILLEQRTVSLDNNTTLAVYRNRLLDSGLYMELDHP